MNEASPVAGVPQRFTWTKILPCLLIALGIALRIRRYESNPSLLLDEAMLAMNIAGRSFAGLLRPLDYEQGAPVGFLLLEKLVQVAAGQGERALRFVPLLGGIVSVPLLWQCARRLLDPAPAILVLAIFSCAEPLVDYSCQVKQYSTDVAWTLVILRLALRASETPSRGRLVTIALVGCAAIWFSHPAIFVLTGICAALGLSTRKFRAAMLIFAAGLMSFAANYLLFLRKLASTEGLLRVWDAEFAPWPTSASRVLWYVQTLLRLPKDLFGNPAAVPDLGHVLSGLALVSLIAGAVHGWRQRRPWLAALLIPLAAALAASLLHKYPFRGRLMLFALPLQLLLLGLGFQSLPRALPGRSIFPSLCAALLAGGPMAVALLAALHPPGRFEIRPVMRYVKSHWMAGDVIRLLPAYQPPFRYYTQYLGPWPWRESDLLSPTPGVADDEPDPALAVHPGRIWIIVTEPPDFRDGRNPSIARWTLRELDRHRKAADELHMPGASVYLLP